MEAVLMLTCPERDARREYTVDFLSHWVSFMCYVYSRVLVWYFQIASMKHAKW